MPADLVAPDARLGRNVTIGANTRVYADVEIGDESAIGDHCVIGHPGGSDEPLVIGAGATIRSHTVVYAGSTIGPGLETGHHVVIREGTRAGVNLRVGNFSDIEGTCEIGDYCRFHGYVHVGKGSTIGDFVWLYSLVTTLNDPMPPSHLTDPVVIGDGAVISVGCQVMPGARVGKGAMATAMTRVAGDVPPGAVIAGEEGKVVNHVGRLMHLASGTRHPWMRHFADAYPEEAQERIAALADEIMENRMTLNIEER
jgi:UDP-3-O-[3-hydroxymyristoyl] glucosamine N-acyltransferase